LSLSGHKVEVMDSTQETLDSGKFVAFQCGKFSHRNFKNFYRGSPH